MQKDYNSIKDTYDLIFHLLSFSYLYGDYAIPHQLMNPTSQAYLSVKKGDIAALRKFAGRNWLNIDRLSLQQQQELDRIYQMLVERFGDQIRAQPSPLPSQLLIELGERAFTFGHYRDAHSFFKTVKELDKKVNELLERALQILRSKEVTAGESDSAIEAKVHEAVEIIYPAVKLKNPFGQQFQLLGPHFHFEDAENARKYAKYVELALVKELLEFGIHFLLDDRTIADKIIGALPSSKVKRILLRQLAIRLSGGIERYQEFVENYHQAIALQKEAKTEKDFLEVQKRLLGRGSGDNRYTQFLRELCVEHPISALMVTAQPTPKGELYICPIMLKSGDSLLDFLALA
ncbi:MAG: hypothetical protein ONB13_06240 [candidate division KSB1 bacterium]|nr:hypothetical protein [candidate division KSB1 bacterium]MDZ7336023.1 hypothetical protein [candidate division KSB1 bacterium]MDZ7358970.1 hypothetical protein [candidate division KSB1 bacterium]MDZ7376201.1 hypothetical protein [candidate division KSB1 bacterium]MDZ7401582.1 hypothetical protein [candidate division KSB1 bacterium]